MKCFYELKLIFIVATISTLSACGSDSYDNPVDVQPINKAPTTVGLSLTTQTGVVINDLLSAEDADNDVLTFMVTSAPISGNLTLMSNGTFSYVPNAGVTGTDSFDFSVNDGINAAVSASVNITIEALAVNLSDFSRKAFNQQATDEPLSLDGLIVSDDVTEGNAYDDLLTP